jgi:hypothetical protein
MPVLKPRGPYNYIAETVAIDVTSEGDALVIP